VIIDAQDTGTLVVEEKPLQNVDNEQVESTFQSVVFKNSKIENSFPFENILVEKVLHKANQ
jgi:hypothetical protein